MVKNQDEVLKNRSYPVILNGFQNEDNEYYSSKVILDLEVYK